MAVPAIKGICLLAALAFFFGCSAQSDRGYSTESPEIEIARKADRAFEDADWPTLRSLYSDGARIFHNSWWGESMTPDEFVELLRRAADTRLGYEFHDDALYELVVKDDGEKWVYAWMTLDVTYTNGVTGRTVNNRMWRIEDNKIVDFFTIYNALPLYRARFDSIPSN